VGTQPFSVAVGNFNLKNNGYPGLAVPNWGDSQGDVSVLLGNGDGTFQAAVPYDVGTAPRSVAVADFNGDGYPDLAVANENVNTEDDVPNGPGSVSVLLGNGDGTFKAAVSYGVGTQPISVAVGDFKGDGKLDLAVANYYSGTVSVLLGNGDGTFQAAATYDVGGNAFSVAVGNFNLKNNGYPDLVVANFGTTTLSVLLGNGDGTFQAAVPYEVGSNPVFVRVADFNGDGYPDLAVTNISSGTVSVLLGNGDGTFQAQATYDVGTEPYWVAVGDFNGDGKPDLAVANYGDGDVSVLLGNGDGTFQAQAPPSPFGSGASPDSIAVGDFNGDGKPDLAVANEGNSDVSILLNTSNPGSAVVTSPSAYSTLTGGSVTFTWSAGTGATGYWLDVGTAEYGNTIYHSAVSSTSQTVSGLPTNGSPVYATLYTIFSNGTKVHNEYTYTAFNAAGAAAVMASPTGGSTLTGSSVTFTWNAGTGATGYWLDVGTAEYGNTIYQSGTLANTVFSKTVSGLPTTGGPVYATLYTIDSNSGTKVYNEYTYTAFNAAGAAATMASPTSPSTLSGNSVTFTWNAGTGATGYWLDVGTAEYGNTIYQSGTLANTVFSKTVSGLPTTGGPVYATLYTIDSNSGTKVYNEYTYTAFNTASVTPAAITSPSSPSTLTANSVTFQWSAGTNVTSYWLDVGNTLGGNQWYQSGIIATLSATAPNIPPNGSTVYVTLYSLAGGLKFPNSYTYTAANGAQMVSPPPGSTPLSGASVTFTWSAGTGFTSYELSVGSTYGGADIYPLTNVGDVTSTTVSGLPTNGSTVYVTLYSVNTGQTVQNYYSYVSAGSGEPSARRVARSAALDPSPPATPHPARTP
jgi:hypothetical protein